MQLNKAIYLVLYFDDKIITTFLHAKIIYFKSVMH